MDLHACVRVYVELFVNEILQTEIVVSMHADRTSFYLKYNWQKEETQYVYFFPWRHAYLYKYRCFFPFFFLIAHSRFPKNCEPRIFFYLRLYPQLQKLRLRACHTPILYKFSLPALWCLLITRVMPRPTTMPFHTHCLKKKYSGYGRAANRSWKEMKKKKWWTAAMHNRTD